MHFEIGFWLAVALMGVAGVALVKILAGTAAGDAFPALRELGAFL